MTITVFKTLYNITSILKNKHLCELFVEYFKKNKLINILNAVKRSNLFVNELKMYVDYLEKEIHWNKLPPIPDLPQAVIQRTSDKYFVIIKRLEV